MKYAKYILFTIIINLLVMNVHSLDFDISSKNAVLYNLNDNTILYELNKDEQIKVASLTKIMTIIVAIENIKEIDKKTILTKDVFYGLAESHAAVVGFSVGEEVTYRDLLYGALLASGADAVNGLVINLSGSEANFIKLMNDKVVELGLKNTHFVNATGLDIDNHYSSVDDIASILKYALKNSLFKEIYEKDEYLTTNGKHTIKNGLNKSLAANNIDMSYIKGSKSGYTTAAKRCLSSTATYSNIDYLLVTAGTETVKEYITDSKEIYEYFFNNYSYKTIVKKGDLLVKLNTSNATEKEVNVYADKTIEKYLSNETDLKSFKLVYEGKNIVDSKTSTKEKIGDITIYQDSIEVESIPIYLSNTLTFSYYEYLKDYKVIIFSVILILLIFIIKKGLS